MSDAPLALVRLLCMTNGTYAYQVGAKKSRAQANADPIWLERLTPLPGTTLSDAIDITIVILPQNVHVTLSQAGKVLHKRMHWVAFPDVLATHGVLPAVYVANQGRGRIRAALFDLGIYPAAVPAEDDHSTVAGEVYEMLDAPVVLAALDEIEGFRPNEPERSLYLRVETDVTLESGATRPAWAYFYNAPLGRAERIPSGDYLEHLHRHP